MIDPKVAIIISNYNGISAKYRGRPILSTLLSGVSKTRYNNYYIILADDHSNDESIGFVRKNYPNVDIFFNKKNEGFSKLNNKAIKYALKKYKPRYILLLNNDLMIKRKDWLKNLVNAIRKDESVGIEGCKLLYPNGKIQHAGLEIGNVVPLLPPYNKLAGHADAPAYSKIKYVSGVTGAVFLIRSDVINKIGFFDENFVMGHEDIDYCLRAEAAGFKILYNGLVSITHLEGFTSTNSKDKNMRLRMFYYFIRNFVYFRNKYRYRYPFLVYMKSQFLLISWVFFNYRSGGKLRNIKNVRLRSNMLIYLLEFIKGYRDGMRISNRTFERSRICDD
ncbi:MAG: glycosyltransferase family 2 protein [Candidatus Micrarchaeaceae archaeon]